MATLVAVKTPRGVATLGDAAGPPEKAGDAADTAVLAAETQRRRSAPNCPRR